MFSADVCVKRPKQCMRIFTQVGHLKENEADKIKRQYIKFIHLYEENPYFKISIFLKTESVSFSLKKMATPRFPDLWVLEEKLLLLPHGQASVKGGFSINSNIEETNL